MTTLKKNPSHPELLHFRAIMAVLLSVIPGLGHIYKAHYRTGVELMILTPFMIWAGVLTTWVTAGAGLLLPLVYLIGVGWHAYGIEDRRHHYLGVL